MHHSLKIYNHYKILSDEELIEQIFSKIQNYYITRALFNKKQSILNGRRTQSNCMNVQKTFFE